jgi:hypothetical protein
VLNGPSQCKLTEYTTIYEFQAQLDSELSLKEGETVWVRLHVWFSAVERM